MIILNLRGGLGNQMFQYAYAYILSKKSDDKIYVSTFYQKREPLNRGVRLFDLACGENICVLPLSIDNVLSVFFKIKKEILLKLLTDTEQKKFEFLSNNGLYVTSAIYSFWGYPECNKKIKYVDGYFQSFKYFEDYKNEIKKLLYPKKNEFSLEFLKIKNKIDNDNSVCVHIRRGDYTSKLWNKSLLICNEEYYINSMEYIAKRIDNPVYYIFSNSHDDIEWIKQNYKLDQNFNVVYVDFNESDIDDFVLMSNCKHFVLSNSSFSWWVQFFSENNTKLVIAPSKWTNENQEFLDVYNKDWIKIYV